MMTLPQSDPSNDYSQEAEEVTRILSTVGDDPRKAEELLPLVYNSLRRLAQSRLSNDHQGQTLQATALVHEAYMRLVGSGDDDWNGRKHFFGAASLAMRRILIDAARKRLAQKRGGERERVDIENIDIAVGMKDEQVIAIDEALAKLQEEDEQAAELVRLRFYAGLNHKEAAEVLGTSERTAKRIWSWARIWLYKEVTKE